LRLAKYLAAAGVASRRKSEQIIAMGRVEVNGAVISPFPSIGSKQVTWLPLMAAR